MELELCKETYSCYEALPPLVETREQSTETIVPDYCPDIARIVEGSGRAMCFWPSAFPTRSPTARCA